MAWEQEVLAARGGRHVFIDAQPQRTLEEWAQAWAMGEQLSFLPSEEVACDGGYCMV